MTANTTNSRAALVGLRVLELGEMVAAPFCGKLLASLGADVVKIEPPKSGDPSRRRGPFPGDSPHPERSGMFLYLNTGKRGVTLDVDDPQGREILRQLAAGADVIIHDSPPALAAARGLEQEALSEINPRLIVAAITPFGSSGPNAGYAAHDVNLFHAGGEGNLLPNGLALDTFPDRAPIAAGGMMASYQGGLTAAVGILGSRRGPMERREWVRRWMRPCRKPNLPSATCQSSAWRPRNSWKPGSRGSSGWAGSCPPPTATWNCSPWSRDSGKGWPACWESRSGHPQDKFRDPATHGPAINENLRQWTAEHTREWLYREGQAHGVPIAPYLTPGEVFESPQQRERDFFMPVDHPEAGSYDYAGMPFRMSETPPTLRRAPLLGEHNAEVYEALGYSPEQLTVLARAEVI